MQNDNIFYTSVVKFGKNLLYRGYSKGKPIKERVPYQPTLFLESKDVEVGTSSSNFTDIHGTKVYPVKFSSMPDAADFCRRHEDSNVKVFGNQNYESTFIYDIFPNDITWDTTLIRVANFDLEWGVGPTGGFCDAINPLGPITAITIQIDNIYYSYGTGDFIVPPHLIETDDIRYIKCVSEKAMINAFLKLWTSNYPDVMTGWWIKFADIPYLINRIKLLFGEDKVKQLSPWGLIREHETVLMNKVHKTYTIVGIGTLDYLELYRKFSPKGQSQESYKLGNICNVEIGEKKISYVEYDNLQNLYEKDYQKFIEYNIHDVKLVSLLDQKLRLLDLAYTLTYQAKCNFDDIFMQTRMWDNLLCNFLRNENVIVPPKKFVEKVPYVGAYVKDPIIGKHSWMMTFDLTSLYPSLIQQYGISPENIIELKDYTPEMHDFLTKELSIDSLIEKTPNMELLKKLNISYTPNGHFFRNQKESFFSRIITKMFNERQMYKKKMLNAEKELELIKNQIKKEGNLPRLLIKQTQKEYEVSKFDILQKVIKICLNSLYGAAGTEGFRFFDVRLAEAVTASGQLSIRWIIHRLNQYLNQLLKTTDVDRIGISDTDSVGLLVNDLVEKIVKQVPGTEISTEQIVKMLERISLEKIQPYIDDCYKDLAEYVNSYDQKMIMKLEKICSSAILVAKKRYIWNVSYNEGVTFNPPKLSITGLDVIKSTTPEIIRNKLWKVIPIILDGTREDVIQFKTQFYKEFKLFQPEDIAIPKGMTGLTKYSDSKTLYKLGTPIHVRGSLVYNKLLKEAKIDNKYQKIHEGEKIRYIYLKIPNPSMENVVCFVNSLPKEFDLHSYVDYDIMFQKVFIQPLNIILKALEWEIDGNINTLDKFFV